MTPTPYPQTVPPPSPGPWVPMDLYVAEREAANAQSERRYEQVLAQVRLDREADRRVQEALRGEDREWLASIAKDVKHIRSELDQRRGADGAHTQHDGEIYEKESATANRRFAMRLAVWTAGVSATFGGGIALVIDAIKGG